MRRWTLSLGVGSALVACLAIGAAGSAGAATLPFTGTLSLQIAPSVSGFPPLVASGAGLGQVTDDGSFHLLSFAVPGSTFGPTTVVVPTTRTTGTGISSLRFTLSKNLAGSFAGISGGPPGGGPMGLSGVAKICLSFTGPGCFTNIAFLLTPTGGGAGFGIGGTRTGTGVVATTMQNAAWTIGQPVMTLHNPNSSTWTPSLPGGFAHGPASLTSSTAQASGALQLVTVSKVYTSLTGAFPEIPVAGVLTVHFVPEPGTLLLFGSGVAGLAFHARRKRGR